MIFISCKRTALHDDTSRSSLRLWWQSFPWQFWYEFLAIIFSVSQKDHDIVFLVGPRSFSLNFFFTDYDDVLECEYYLPRTDQWVKVAPMLTGQSDVGIAVYNDRIYVTGGYR